MKSKEFITEASQWSKVDEIVDALNAEISRTVQEKYPKGIQLVPLAHKSQSSRVWTRGDGSRYKEPGMIRVSDGAIQYNGRKYATFKRLFPNEQALLNHVWEVIKSKPNSKDMGKVSGEFGSDNSDPALQAGGMLWIKRRYGIEYGSLSRLKNTSIWRHTPLETNEAENFPSVKTYTSDQIAKKHGVLIDQIEKELFKGTRVELEHTTDVNQAREIALDHLLELPDYYTRLSKMERE